MKPPILSGVSFYGVATADLWEFSFIPSTSEKEGREGGKPFQIVR
jgi:hypothetical protein